MAYTEVQEKNKKRYYYRVRSIRQGNKVGKKRVFLGSNLGKKGLRKAEREADRKLGLLNDLLTDEEISFLKKVKKAYSEQSSRTFKNRYEAFISLFTHD